MKSRVQTAEDNSLLGHLSSLCEDRGSVLDTKEGRKGMREEGERKDRKEREEKKGNHISKEKHQRFTTHVHGITVNRLSYRLLKSKCPFSESQ